MYKKSIIYQMFLRMTTAEGTIAAAERLLGHVASLGVDIVYLCPVFEADDDTDKAGWSKRQCESGCENPKNPYRMKDYFKIDEEYGTDGELKHFISAAHKKGLSVILDLVYYHCGPNAEIIKINPDFVRRLPDGSPDCGDWHFPRINFDNPKLREYLWSNMEYLIREFDADGFRCDVGDMVPLDFWREGRRRIEKIKPDIIMINEGNNPEYIKSGVFDMNYSLSWGLDALEQVKTRFSESIAKGEMRNRKIICYENHDAASDAADNRLDKKHGASLGNALMVLIFTCGAVPFLYNGNEIADRSRQSIYANRFHEKAWHVDYSGALTDEGAERMRLIKSLSDIRHGISAVSGEDIRVLSDRDGLIAFERVSEKERLFVAASIGEEEGDLRIPPEYPEGAEVLLQSGVSMEEDVLRLKVGGYAVLLNKSDYITKK